MKVVAIWLTVCGGAFLVGAAFAAVGVVTVARMLAQEEEATT